MLSGKELWYKANYGGSMSLFERARLAFWCWQTGHSNPRRKWGVR